MKYIIEIIKCKIRDRTTRNQSDLLEFFLKGTYEREMSNDLMYGNLSVEALFYFSSQFMDIKHFRKNEVLYYEGDICENIYLVLAGKMLLRRLNEVVVDYSAEEYFLHLKAIKSDGFLLNRTLEMNNSIFPLRAINEIDDIDDIDTLIIKAKLLKHAASYEVDSIINYLKIKRINPRVYGFNVVIKGESSIQTYYEDFLYSLTQTELFYIKQLNNYNKTKLTIYDYIPTSEKRKGDYFGNFKLGNSICKREESSIALTNIILIEISKKMYSGCILNDQKQLREKILDYLHQSFFFKGVRKNAFQKYIFNELELVEYNKDHILFNENDHLDTLYIIKEGSVELSLSNKSLIDIKGLIAYIKSIDERFQGEEFNDTIQLSNSPNILMPFFKEKKNYVLMKIMQNILCDWEYHYEVNSIYTARVCSDRTKIYQIPLEKIRSHLDEDLKIFNRYLKEASYNKLSTLLKRVIMIKNAAIEKIDIEFTSRTKKEDNAYLLSENKLVLSKSNEKMLRKARMKHQDSNSTLKTIVTERNNQPKHRKGVSMNCIVPSNLPKKKEKIHRSTLLLKEKSFRESSCNQKTQIDVKDPNELLIKKGRLFLKEAVTQTNKSLASPIFTLPNLRVVPPKKMKKNERMTFKLKQQKQKRIINLEIPREAVISQFKHLNYLAVQKFYEENRTHRSIHSFK